MARQMENKQGMPIINRPMTMRPMSMKKKLMTCASMNNCTIHIHENDDAFAYMALFVSVFLIANLMQFVFFVTIIRDTHVLVARGMRNTDSELIKSIIETQKQDETPSEVSSA